jgi:molecular chaperone GrpE (heat shock protein)
MARRGRDELELKTVDTPVAAAEPTEADSVPSNGHPELLVFSRAYTKTSERLEELKELFEARISHDEQKQQLFNRLYDDLEAQKQERLRDQRFPLYRSLIMVLDRIDGLRSAHLDSAEPLESIRQEIVDALTADGVEEIIVDPQTVDPRRQQIVGIAAALPAHLAWQNIRSGYEVGTRVIRAQHIEVPRGPELRPE